MPSLFQQSRLFRVGWVPFGLAVDPDSCFGHRLCRGHVVWFCRPVLTLFYLTLTSWSLFELDRDTLHTRWVSAHECHSGVRLLCFRVVSLMPVGLALHGPVSVDRATVTTQGRDGCIHSPGTGMLTVPIGLGQI
uniref:Uncharacterized protein n=1 Tax=Ananas comosus var. bracteatus TaxID=296719 RepID=A0A6V7NPT9_ANACO|nr:unnamed protein product [Ananas comosus var. bracteatus]